MRFAPVSITRFQSLKTLCLLLTVLAAVLLAVLYLASHLFLIKLGNPALPPSAALRNPLLVWDYWRQYGNDAYTRQWLGYCLAGGSVPFVGAAAFLLRRRVRPLHGDSRFATRREIREAGLLTQSGIIVGRMGRYFLMLGRQLAALVVAPPRSGKGAGLVQPNALSWTGSMVVNDPRNECYLATAGWRAVFSEVHLFAPLSQDGCTAQFNPISRLYVPDDPALRINKLQKLANMLSPDPPNADPFWPASCRDLFLGLALYVIETPGVSRTMGQMMREIMHGNDDGIGEHWRAAIAARDESGNPLSPTCKRMMYDFISLSPPTQSSIRKTFTGKLQLWNNPLVDAATSGDSFDLHELRRRRITIYLGVEPGDLDRLSMLMNLFFTMMLDANMDKMPQHDKTIKFELLPILDEWAAMGRMTIIEKTIQLMGGYGIRPLLIVHSEAQLEAIYGDKMTRHIRSCCGARIVFAPNDDQYAADISRSLGSYTTQSTSRSRPVMSHKLGSTSTGLAARALMNPQEVRLMGYDNQIVFVEHTRPIFCQKTWYWKERVFRRRADRPVPHIEPVEILLPPAPTAPAPKATANGGGGRSPRSITPADVPKLGKLSLTDYAVDFSKVQLPKGEPITADDLDKAFDSFIKAVDA